MNIQVTFDLIISSFRNIFQDTIHLHIKSELDWEKHIYVELRKNLNDDAFNRYVVHLEGGTFKHGNDTLWISPNKYNKKKHLIDRFYAVERDEGGHYKLNLKKNIDNLDSEIKKLIEAEKKRFYYVDIVIYDKEVNHSIAYLELKYGINLSRSIVLEDYYKLKRLEQIRNFNAIYIAVGYDPANNRIFWLPTNSKFNYNFSQNKLKERLEPQPGPESFSEEKVINKIKQSTKLLYENVHATEAHWAGELIYSLHSLIPGKWRINSEIPMKEKRYGRIDLAIFNDKNEIHTAIELKNHFENPFPVEILNDLYRNEKLEEDFLQQTSDFIEKYEYDRAIIKKRSAFPSHNNKYYLNSDFFEKIIEIYSQCKRITELIKSRKIVNGFLIYIDHNNDFTLRKKTHSVSEVEFIKNFSFRKSLIEKILAQHSADECKFVYMYKLNSKNNIKKVFFD